MRTYHGFRFGWLIAGRIACGYYDSRLYHRRNGRRVFGSWCVWVLR